MNNESAGYGGRLVGCYRRGRLPFRNDQELIYPYLRVDIDLPRRPLDPE